ncbi:dihydrolipoyl dehydrogenase [Fusibacter paucivorans]|uniref:Dihydrolipoyl dehydrogenase n=1 Tax=Fusibacter paucivorans TaxID=76009 RepID=A0ABS5PTT1_9FIRM|nr:dihydrolipoyl dehydrogenase [Fusibacter paucivorans]MBS7528585.1 dihydrolipoyl dehydrogenase [Fusibacter paucivorans]
MNKYDVAIIGGGPGGYVAAIRASQHGLKTVLVEKDQIGGTCLNIGCIPTKALVKNAELLHEIKNAKNRGIICDAPKVDMKAVLAMKNNVVKQLTGGVGALLKANGVTVFQGEANVISEHELTVQDHVITFENLIIATGSSNNIPPIPGLDMAGILTSTELLEMEAVPESLVIIGGGVIGCEFATVFSQFGSKVTVVEMQDALIPNMDLELSKGLKRSLTAAGVSVLTGCSVTKVEKNDDDYQVTIRGDKDTTISAACVMVSVGRKSNLAGLSKLPLTLERNYIQVDDEMATNLEHVYAIGDVTGKIQLAHVASAQGLVAADCIAGKKRKMSYEIVPSCIYTLPEIGSVGLSEQQARAAYDAITVGVFPMAACGKAVAMGQTTGFTKLIADEKSGKIIGCHIFGPNATEIISEAAAVMKAGGTLVDIAETIHAHPTINESMHEAAHVALKEPIHMM